MKLGIMQPYFLPYLGHFALIAAVDEWVVFDVVQYTRKIVDQQEPGTSH